MKLNKSLIFSHIIMLIIGTLILFYFGDLIDIIKIDGDKSFKILKIIGYCVGGLLVLTSIAGVLFSDSEFYYKFVYIPIEDLEVRKYKNLIVFAKDGRAWYYTDKIEKFSNLKKIKAIFYYNRKKEYNGYLLLPLTTLKEEKKKNAPVAQ